MEYMFVVLLRFQDQLVLAEAPEEARGLYKGNLAAFTLDGIREDVGIIAESTLVAKDDDTIRIFRELHPEMGIVTRVWSKIWSDEEMEEKELD